MSTQSGLEFDEIKTQTVDWLSSNLFTTDAAVQIGLLVAAILVARLLSPKLQKWMKRLGELYQEYAISRLFSVISSVALPLIWVSIQHVAIAIPRVMDLDDQILVVTTSLLSAWIFIRVASTFISNPLIARVLSIIAWLWAALTILGLWNDATVAMSGIGFQVGEIDINLMRVVEGIATLVGLLWVSSIVGQIFENSIKTSPNLTPSIQVLSSKLIRMGLIAFAFFASLAIVGIDLTALAIFSGAIGVGLGFGLQKIFGNLVSGFILLLDKSIKPGDVIALPGYYGRVDSLGARYVSVYTRDGTEHLIPNEDLIVNRVENWTHSQNFLRLRQALGIHYKSDVRLAMSLCLEAANEIPRILKEPKPSCLLRGYGDSSVDLEVRFWIDDPMGGRANVRSDLLLNIWDKFHEHEIEIPYPQQDLHLRSSSIGRLNQSDEE